MRTDKEFIDQLRQEMMAAQGQRFKYVIAKISFVISLLGLGSISAEINIGTNNLSTGPLLYLVPIVVFVFDLYIAGEDYGIKRAGKFIGGLATASLAERDWEKYVSKNRDKFSYLAGFISSGIAFIVSAIAIHYINLNMINYYVWLIVGALFVSFPLGYHFIRDYFLNKKSLSSKIDKFDVLKNALKEEALRLGDLGKDYQGQGDHEIAKKYLVRSRELYLKIGMPDMVEKVQRLIDSLKGEIRRAD